MGAIPLERKPTWSALIDAANHSCGFIMLGHGKYSLVDQDLMPELESHNWRLSDNGYVKRSVGPASNRVSVYLHRLVYGATENQDVDHKNLNKKDNRLENLRGCNSSQNNANGKTRSHNRASKYKGVRFKRGRWYARSVINRVEKSLGGFDTEAEAAKAYNDWAVIAFGEFARLNVIE